MFKRVLYTGSVVVLLCYASLCFASEVAQIQAIGSNITPGMLQKLRQPIPRQTIISALLSNPTTKSVLIREASKMGVPVERLSTLTQAPLFVKSVTILNQREETELRNLNWAGGFTFTPFASPTYGTGNWKLGVIDMHYARLQSWIPEITLLVIPYAQVKGIITLTIELPKEPGLYAITIKLVKQSDGKSNPSWILGGSIEQPLNVLVLDYINGQYPEKPPIALVMLPDSTGFVGLASVNPSQSSSGTAYGMRKQTSQIRVDIKIPPSRVGVDGRRLESQSMQQLIFGSISIMRL